ncbi:hypothetical protein EMELA_v1c04540 [Mesoplasma melaleucae]|uniref:Uncharacterized protein n=1 Tax=Mesoplasma melaleucae TaxID=81459 RepID=A0A2K8NW57_9MOLU|nr:hypothetical protein EMELA_v1c04540 [Mesoplasma melaleucae]
MVLLCKKVVENGAKVLISNFNSKQFENIIIKVFGDCNYIKEKIVTNRSINPNAKNKKRFLETLYILK